MSSTAAPLSACVAGHEVAIRLGSSRATHSRTRLLVTEIVLLGQRFGRCGRRCCRVRDGLTRPSAYVPRASRRPQFPVNLRVFGVSPCSRSAWVWWLRVPACAVHSPVPARCTEARHASDGARHVALRAALTVSHSACARRRCLWARGGGEKKKLLPMTCGVDDAGPVCGQPDRVLIFSTFPRRPSRTLATRLGWRSCDARSEAAI